MIVFDPLAIALVVASNFAFDQLKKDKEKEKSSINDQITDSVTQSYPDLGYQTLANAAYEGMRYCAGDSYSDVETVMKKMQNNLDVAMLVDAFGIRQNYCFGIPAGTPLDLLSFVRKELGNDWGGLTDYRVRRINENWQKKGITYKV